MKIGFIGLGTMGRGMASNLLKAGNDLVVHDLRKEAAAEQVEAGAAWAETPRELAAQCAIVFTSLPAPPDVEAICEGDNGLAAGLREGAAWFDLTTNSVNVVRKLHARLAEHGVHFLDAPVSGGAAGAASGKMAIWAGGDSAVFERWKTVLEGMSDEVRYIGPIGAGTIAKLVHNAASTAISAVLTEVFTMGVKAGLDPLPLWEAVREGGIGRQRTFEKLGTRILPGQHDKPSFALRLAEKDLRLALQLGRDFNVPMRLCSLVEQDLAEALERGWGGRDAMAASLLQQERAGIEPFSVPLEKINAVIGARST